ncbi:Asp/Glu/hydantoin racemase [Paraburkholderia ginsengiterrae]|uniref:Asp/Glu/hydantoin racemase n=1 Tax=Paraburkholderia ginsengiterrae TaxID=1462993 RepID=A0A1A9N4X7_9BURK|nr:aspartate/glutamate racemase family protein [Paraburkholderia ginsengiterrae]OAJ53250.1 Asp/Glu/hydantoin racemase [Paraburkholderia ginsengiterrae]OAJ56713.1 Asp/Glu/hydantoin racemase [Paraburkholderia ginsengiterrae]
MSKRVLLGMLTPSSNTALEPITSAMVAQLPGVSAHFSRFRVTEISLSETALGQFDTTHIIQAAKLLADAKVDVIAWNGTSSGWLGFDTDRRLCREIEEATGIPATTSVLALNEILEQTGVKKFGLVSPYLKEVQQKIVANYRDNGIDCASENHLGLKVNFEFSEVTEDTLREQIREVATQRPEAIVTFCTNLRAAHLAAEVEQNHGIPLYDTISTVVWKSLKLAGYDTTRVTGWGRLFSEVV